VGVVDVYSFVHLVNGVAPACPHADPAVTAASRARQEPLTVPIALMIWPMMVTNTAPVGWVCAIAVITRAPAVVLEGDVLESLAVQGAAVGVVSLTVTINVPLGAMLHVAMAVVGVAPHISSGVVIHSVRPGATTAQTRVDPTLVTLAARKLLVCTTAIRISTGAPSTVLNSNELHFAALLVHGTLWTIITILLWSMLEVACTIVLVATDETLVC